MPLGSREIKKAVGTGKPGRVNTSPPKSVGKSAPVAATGSPHPLNTVQHAQLPAAPRAPMQPDPAQAAAIAQAILARRGGQ